MKKTFQKVNRKREQRVTLWITAILSMMIFTTVNCSSSKQAAQKENKQVMPSFKYSANDPNFPNQLISTSTDDEWSPILLKIDSATHLYWLSEIASTNTGYNRAVAGSYTATLHHAVMQPDGTFITANVAGANATITLDQLNRGAATPIAGCVDPSALPPSVSFVGPGGVTIPLMQLPDNAHYNPRYSGIMGVHMNGQTTNHRNNSFDLISATEIPYLVITSVVPFKPANPDPNFPALADVAGALRPPGATPGAGGPIVIPTHDAGLCIIPLVKPIGVTQGQLDMGKAQPYMALRVYDTPVAPALPVFDRALITSFTGLISFDQPQTEGVSGCPADVNNMPIYTTAPTCATNPANQAKKTRLVIMANEVYPIPVPVTPATNPPTYLTMNPNGTNIASWAYGVEIFLAPFDDPEINATSTPSPGYSAWQTPGTAGTVFEATGMAGFKSPQYSTMAFGTQSLPEFDGYLTVFNGALNSTTTDNVRLQGMTYYMIPEFMLPMPLITIHDVNKNWTNSRISLLTLDSMYAITGVSESVANDISPWLHTAYSATNIPQDGILYMASQGRVLPADAANQYNSSSYDLYRVDHPTMAEMMYDLVANILNNVFSAF